MCAWQKETTRKSEAEEKKVGEISAPLFNLQYATLLNIFIIFYTYPDNIFSRIQDYITLFSIINSCKKKKTKMIHNSSVLVI